MKVGAHPMLVAAALGLLGPAALEESEDRRQPCVGCDCGLQAACTSADSLDQAELTDAVTDEMPMIIVPGPVT